MNRSGVFSLHPLPPRSRNRIESASTVSHIINAHFGDHRRNQKIHGEKTDDNTKREKYLPCVYVLEERGSVGIKGEDKRMDHP